MSKRSRKHQRTPKSLANSSPPTARVPWWHEKIKPWIAGGWFLFGVICTAFFAVVLNAPTFLQNLRAIPGEIDVTKSQFLSWSKEDSEWTGHWSSFPEGIVNIPDLQLSEVDLQITIWSNQGDLDGTIATKKICKLFPMWDYVLLRGNVDGKTAVVTAFDFVQGHEREFAKLKLTRDGMVLSVVPIAGAVDWFPSSARIARHPIGSEQKPEPDMEFCQEEKIEFFERFKKAGQDNS